MELPEPRALQLRTAAMSLLVIAALGAFRVALIWQHSLIGPLTLPLLIAFLLFNIGYLWAGTKVRFDRTGAKLGAAAVALGLSTILLPTASPILWSAVSLTAAALALVGAGLLFGDASGAPA